MDKSLAHEPISATLRAQAERLLAHWGSQAAPELLKQRENAVFRVAMPDGHPAVLRIHRPDYHSEAALRSELEWMTFLHRQGLPTPAAIETRAGTLLASDRQDGFCHYADCLTWRSGSALRDIQSPSQMSARETARVFHALGSIAARMHEVARTWRPPAGFVRHVWDSDAFLGKRPLWGGADRSPWLDDAERGTVVRARALAAEELQRYGRTARNFGLIHADLIGDNVLWDGEALSVIDFDDSGYGWYLYDIAVALYQYRLEPDYAPIEQALLAGYQSYRPIARDDAGRMPLFFALRAIALIGWWTSRADTPVSPSIARSSVAKAVRTLELYEAGTLAPNFGCPA